MNILMLSKIDISRPTGETEHFLGLAEGFVKSGHNVIIVCPEPSSKNKNFGDKIHFIFIKSGQSKFKSLIFQFFLIFYFPLIFIRYKIDFVYIRQGPFLFLPALLAKLLEYKIVTEINGLMQEDMKILYNPPKLIIRFSEICERLSYRLSNKIITVTPQLKSFIQYKYNIYNSKIGIFSNGVNTDFYHSEKIKHKTFNVLYTGSSAPWQGLNTLSDAIDIVNSNDLPINFIIISDKPVLKKNTEYFINMDRESIKKIFSKIDISVAPYKTFRNIDSGISPIKVFTYLSGSKPVIIPNIGEISSQIKQHNAGIVIDSDSSKELAEAILYMYKHRKRLLPVMSNNARRLAEEFDWKIIASKIINFVYN